MIYHCKSRPHFHSNLIIQWPQLNAIEQGIYHFGINFIYYDHYNLFGDHLRTKQIFSNVIVLHEVE